MGQSMRKQDLLELYQLLWMYEHTYHPEEKLKISEWMERLGQTYAHITGGDDIQKGSNPRGAGRKKKYTQEKDKDILNLKKEGKSLRTIAYETGCSLGYVQEVIRHR